MQIVEKRLCDLLMFCCLSGLLFKRPNGHTHATERHRGCDTERAREKLNSRNGHRKARATERHGRVTDVLAAETHGRH